MGDKNIKWIWGTDCDYFKDKKHHLTDDGNDLWCPYCGRAYYKDRDPEAKLIMVPENQVNIRC